MARYLVAVCAAVAMMLTGCTTVVTGTPVPDPELRVPLTSQLAFGDLTTIDYCSLLDIESLGDAGVRGIGATTSTFNYCFAKGSLGERAVEFGLGYLESHADQGQRVRDTTRTLKRNLTAQRSVANDDRSCTMYLLFPDMASLQVYTDDTGVTAGGSADELCEVAGSVLDGMVTVLLAKKVGHLTFPAGSAGTVDACQLLPQEQVAAYFGQQPMRTPEIPTRHRCRWLDPLTRDSVNVQFDGGKAPSGGLETIAGRPTEVAGVGAGYCRASTAVGSPAASGDSTLAQVYYFARAGRDACQAVRDLATAAWPKLPSS